MTAISGRSTTVHARGTPREGVASTADSSHVRWVATFITSLALACPFLFFQRLAKGRLTRGDNGSATTDPTEREKTSWRRCGATRVWLGRWLLAAVVVAGVVVGVPAARAADAQEGAEPPPRLVILAGSDNPAHALAPGPRWAVMTVVSQSLHFVAAMILGSPPLDPTAWNERPRIRRGLSRRPSTAGRPVGR